MISIVVPAYNAERMLNRCVEALLLQTGLDAMPEIIIVDDGSTDGTANVVRPVRGITLITQPNAGPGAARNRGLRAARGEFVLFTDSDCEPKPDWAAELVKGFVDDGVAAVMGLTIHDDRDANIYELTVRGRDIVGREAGPITLLNSNNTALRRSLTSNFSFDEALGIYGEDTDLGWRLIAAGHRIWFQPSAIVKHHHPFTRGSFFKNGYREGLGAARLHYKHGKWLPRDLAPALLALLFLVLSPLSRIFAWTAGACFLLFLAALIFNELYLKRKPLLLSLLTYPLQFSWYGAKLWGYLQMTARILAGREPALSASRLELLKQKPRQTP